MSATSQFPEGQQPAGGLSASKMNQVTLRQTHKKASLLFLHLWVTLSRTRIQHSHILRNVCGCQGSKLACINMFHLNIPPKCLVGLVLFYFASCAWNRPCSPVSEAAISSVQWASGTAEALSGALSSQRCPHSACPSPTWALCLWLFPAAQSSVVFPAPLLTPCLGCRTQQLAAENVRVSTTGRVMDSSLLGYN